MDFCNSRFVKVPDVPERYVIDNNDVSGEDLIIDRVWLEAYKRSFLGWDVLERAP